MAKVPRTIVREMETDVIRAVELLPSRPNVSRPSPQEIRSEAEKYGVKTNFGNYNFVSSVKNRSAALTVYLGTRDVEQKKLNDHQKHIIHNLPSTLAKLHEYFKHAPFVRVKRFLGQNRHFVPQCKLYVSVHRRDAMRLPCFFSGALYESAQGAGPDLSLVYIPEWHEANRQILVFPREGVTYVLGTDYYGEVKKGFLRMAMWLAKQQNMLGLHAGTKLLVAKDKNGKPRRYGVILFGLTATGKTTHSCHDHGLTAKRESAKVLQDDVVFLCKDGTAYGTERGYYVKTEGLDPETQPALYQACTNARALLENVMVDYEGNVHFDEDCLTGNGRTVVRREDLGRERAARGIDLPRLSDLDGLIIAFITRRNTVVPIASKLTPEQAAGAFMLGESIESSGSDPRKAGQSVRVVGTNPFLIGDEAEEGNWFYDFVKTHEDKVQCYLLNTGGIGEIRVVGTDGIPIVKQGVTRVLIPEMASIIRGIARGAIEWTDDPLWKAQLPKKVEGMDISRFALNRFYLQRTTEKYSTELKRERIEYLERFPKLDPAITESYKF
jgi:phosphoenolpyruvate carboxykinase (ATP)